MNIGFDAKRATQNFTGLGNYSRFVINNLIKYYPDNTYDLFSPSDNFDKVELAQGRNINTNVKKGIRPFWRSYSMTKDIKKANLDIYHGLSNELPIAVERTGVKTVVTIHDLIFLVHPEYYKTIDRKIYDFKARHACRIADKIVAVSECTKRDIIKYYGVNPEKIEVVYQGCFSIFKQQVPESVKMEVRSRYNLPTNYLLSVGSIEDRKNILLIVKALKYLPDDVHFVAIGKARKYAEQVQKYASLNNLDRRVHILNNVTLKDLPAILQSSSVFIYPSLYEGFGIPIIESLSSGVPVIAARGSCLEEAGGPDSIYVDPNDEKQLALEVEHIFNNAILRRRMIDKGLEYVSLFSDENCTRSLMNVYNNIIK